MKKEFELLRSMWKKSAERSKELIVPKVTAEGITGSLHNDFWAYKVGYGFRTALSISYDQRFKNKKPYMVWTQGANIHFKDGDFIESRCGLKSVQIQSASVAEWDKEKEEMNLGSVVYDSYKKSGTGWKKLASHKHNQMEFLALLISGRVSTVEEVLSEE